MSLEDFKKMVSDMRARGVSTRIARAQMKELSEIGITEMMLRELGVEIVDEIPQPRPDEETIAICISAQEYIFADNVFTVCAECGGGIQHRPDLPAFIKKVCLKCAAKPNDSQSNSSAK